MSDAGGLDPDDEAVLRLLGQPEGRRVLVLGCGAGEVVVALARQGARVIGVDPSAADLDAARARGEAEDVRAELHHGDLAELAFVRADTIDAAVSLGALAGVDDLDRVFRQVHRVLRPECPLVLTLPHPAGAVAAGGSYFDRDPRAVGEVHASLLRANFRVDVLGEPKPAPGATAPTTLVVRAKKEGI